jgi:CYTH domain-containing protein
LTPVEKSRHIVEYQGTTFSVDLLGLEGSLSAPYAQPVAEKPKSILSLLGVREIKSNVENEGSSTVDSIELIAAP